MRRRCRSSYKEQAGQVAENIALFEKATGRGGMRVFGKLVWSIAAVAIGLGGFQAANAADEDVEIPLKLFGKEDIEQGITRCRFSIWQGNRDPEADRYAYLLHANMDEGDASLGPARLKIGKTVHTLYELVSGGEPIDGMAPQFLFATKDRKVTVHVELEEVSFSGEQFLIDDASLTVFQSGKVPFVANAKGVSGCSSQGTAAAKAETSSASVADGIPAGIPIGQETYLNDSSEVPYVLTQLMEQYASDDCDVGGYSPWAGARYVINENYLLWQLPCFSGAYQGSGVFAVTQNPARDWGDLLTLPNPPSLEGNQNYAAMNADVDGPNGLIKTTELNRGVGDCGVYQVFRLIDGPGEVLELELMQFREKTNCDGNATAPESWPLAYQSY